MSFGFGIPATSSAGTNMFGSSTNKTGANIFGTTSTASGFGGFSGFGGTNKTTTSTASGLFGSTLTSTSGSSTNAQGGSVLNFGNPTSSTSSFKGLGGIDPTKTSSASNTGSKPDSISQAVKDQNIPDLISNDVKAFEDYVAKQKEESNSVGKFSVQSLHKVNDEIKGLASVVTLLSTTVSKNKSMIERLHKEFSTQLLNIEMARQTQDIPMTLQPGNFAPLKYFSDLVVKFSTNMQTYKVQIEELENHLHSISQPCQLTPQDISIALCKMQEGFISLAANLYSIHNQTNQLKEQYSIYRQVVYGDNLDIFAEKKEKIEKTEASLCEGPSPLSNMSNVAALAMATMLQPQQQAMPTQGFNKTTFGAGGSFGTTTTSSNIFGKTKSASFSTSNTLRPTLSAGFVKSTSGDVFFGSGATTFNQSAGVTFGGSASKQGAATFELKPAPQTSKRNRK